MKPVTLLLMTKKGYTLLVDIVDRFGPLIEEVQVGTDAALDNDYSTEIIEHCERKGLAWSRRTPGQQIRTEYAMTVSWRWMVEHPESRLIVFHDSLLPRYRGFNPLVSCLVNGDRQIGVTALLGARQYDAGAILAQSSTEIDYPMTVAHAIDALRGSYRATAADVLARIETGETLSGVPQDEALATYSLWRDEEDYRIPWDRPADWIARFVDALGSPYKGASTIVDGVLCRVPLAKALPDVRIENRTPGKVIRLEGDFPVVVCGDGLLQVMALVNDASGVPMLPLARFRTRFH